MTTEAVRRDWSWQDRALCVRLSIDPDLFFPEGNKEPDAEIVAVCKQCPVRPECHMFAVAGNEAFGIWGGTRQTRDQHRQRRREGVPS